MCSATPAALDALHVYAPACCGAALLMVRKRVCEPNIGVATPASACRDALPRSHSMATGRSPLGTWHASSTMSPALAAPSSLKGVM